ncbi:MAG: hypothetical protein V1874_06015 [Spirochaetota bacterium]
MWKDSIIEEIHKYRDDYLKQFNYDIHEICKDIRKKQNQNERQLIAPKPRPAKKIIKTA